MANNSLKDLKKLRQETGARIMDCKKALQEAEGDFAKAQELVAAKGLARAEKKADRETKVGYLGSYVHTDGMKGALVKLLCETDFVAQNEEFTTLANELAMQVTAMNPADVEELLGQDFIKEPNQTVETVVKALSGKIGEKMVVSEFIRFEV